MPSNYAETTVGGNFEKPNLGGHKMVIMDVKEMMSKTNKQMIKVCFDFAKDDAQADFFSKKYKEDTRTDKKWSNVGTQYIMVLDNEGKTSKSFKSFCTSVEESNPGFKIPWGDGFAQSFKGKKVGGVFRAEEVEYNGKIGNAHKLAWFCASDKALSQEVPPTKKLANNGMPTQGQSVASFMDIPSGIDEELPFN